MNKRPQKQRGPREHGLQQTEPRNLIGGRKPLLELLRHERDRISEVLLLPELKLPLQLELTLKEAQAEGLKVSITTQEQFELWFGELHHQGVATFVKPQRNYSAEDIAEAGLQPESSGIVLVLDQIADPQNLGASFRAADASGAAGVIYTRDHSAPLSAAARKASAGASELIKSASTVNLARTLNMLQERGYWIVGAALGQDTQELYQFPLRFPVALVLGSEGKGLRKLTKECCDVLVQIPLYGRIESLNVSQAAAVFLYELMRKKLSNNKE